MNEDIAQKIADRLLLIFYALAFIAGILLAS